MTTADPQVSTDGQETAAYLEGVGKRLRSSRRELKLTLKELSLKTDVPLSTLSKVETGQMSLNIQKLVKVCSALNIDVMQLVSPEPPQDTNTAMVTGRRSITRLGDSTRIKTQQTVYNHHASDFLNRKFAPSIIELEAYMRPDLIRHQGEEFIYVLEGEVEVLTEFYEPTSLSAGESIYIDSTMGHNVRAKGGKPAKIMNVTTTGEASAD